MVIFDLTLKLSLLQGSEMVATEEEFVEQFMCNLGLKDGSLNIGSLWLVGTVLRLLELLSHMIISQLVTSLQTGLFLLGGGVRSDWPSLVVGRLTGRTLLDFEILTNLKDRSFSRVLVEGEYNSEDDD